MFTLEDTQKLHKLMNQNPDNDAIIKKLLDSHQFTISKISHEIRNPLTLISSTLQLMEKQHPEVARFSHWSSVLEDIDFMKHLLEDLSSYNNGFRLHAKLIHTSEFINHIILSFASSIVDTAIELSSKIDQNLPDIWGDPIKLRELFLNLLQNAADAVDGCGKIQLQAYRRYENIIVTITDNGCGIPSSRLSDIFAPFTTYKANGTGLGLAIVKSVADAHHGSVEVRSALHAGTTFTITLPIQNRPCQEPGK